MSHEHVRITTHATRDGWKSDAYLALLARWAPAESVNPFERLKFIAAVNTAIWEEYLLSSADLKRRGDRLAELVSESKELLVRAAGILEDLADQSDHWDPAVAALALRAAVALGGDDEDE